MKFKYLFIFTMLVSLFIAGCSNDTNQVEKTIEVQKRVGDNYNYEDFRVITDKEKVKKVREILNDINWENAKVDMAHPPDYQFAFPNPEAKVALYELWVSPNKDRVSLVIEAESKYIHLDKKRSEELFKILTGKKLSYS